jgi:hypothetical protein
MLLVAVERFLWLNYLEEILLVHVMMQPRLTRLHQDKVHIFGIVKKMLVLCNWMQCPKMNLRSATAELPRRSSRLCQIFPSTWRLSNGLSVQCRTDRNHRGCGVITFTSVPGRPWITAGNFSLSSPVIRLHAMSVQRPGNAVDDGFPGKAERLLNLAVLWRSCPHSRIQSPADVRTERFLQKIQLTMNAVVV